MSSNSGYGYGIWLPVSVPNCLQEVIEQYNHNPHQPHVTIKPNLSLDEAATLIDTLSSSYSVEVNNPQLELSKNMYAHDPLQGWVMPVTLLDSAGKLVDLGHQPHITLVYAPAAQPITVEIPKLPQCEFISISKPRIADIRSLYPWEWIVL
jgi:hypothetical protein